MRQAGIRLIDAGGLKGAKHRPVHCVMPFEVANFPNIFLELRSRTEDVRVSAKFQKGCKVGQWL